MPAILTLSGGALLIHPSAKLAEVKEAWRSDQLSFVNQSFRQGQALLAGCGSLDEGLGQIFLALCQGLEACGHLFAYDPASNSLTTRYHVNQTGLHSGAEADAAPLLLQPFDADITPWFRQSLRQREILVVEHALMNPRERELCWPGVIEWHELQGRTHSCAVPLVAGDLPLGVVGLSWNHPVPFSEAQKQLLEALCNQAATVMLASALAQSREAAALAQQRQRAAELQAANLAKSNAALQATVEAFSAIESLTDLVPRVLEVTAQAFGATSCAVFKNAPSGTVWLHYWYSEGKTFMPEEMLQLDGEKYALVRILAQGFQVSDDYLGGPPAEVIGPVLLDHVAGTAVAEFDQFAIGAGWELELNIGVGPPKKRVCTLCIYRARTHPFTPSEVELGAMLAKQMALAVQASELAAQAKLTTLAQVRQEAAEERAALVEQVNKALQNSVDRLISCDQMGAAVSETLRTISEVLADLGVSDTGLVTLNADGKSLRPRLLLTNGEASPIQGTVLDRDWNLEDPELAVPWLRIQSEDFIWGPTSDTSVLVPKVKSFHEARGTRSVAYQPLRRSGRTMGWIALSLQSDQPPTEQQIGLIRALGGQVSLALELNRLADEASGLAILKERNRIARDIHDSLAQCFTGILMQLQAAKEYLAEDRQVAQSCLARAESLSRQGLREARQSVLNLMPQTDDSHDLAATIRQLAEQSTAFTASPCQVLVLGKPRPVPQITAHNLVHIFRECLGNAQRYSRAANIEVHLDFSEQGVKLMVADDGIGFDPVSAAPVGFGLSSMRERCERIGAKLAILSAPGQGTRVVVELSR